MYTAAADQPALRKFVRGDKRKDSSSSSSVGQGGSREEIIGRRFEMVFDDAGQQYYTGTICSWRPKSKTYRIRWDDEDPRETIPEGVFVEKCTLLPRVNVQDLLTLRPNGKRRSMYDICCLFRCIPDLNELVVMHEPVPKEYNRSMLDDLTLRYSKLIPIDTLRAQAESGSSASVSTVASKAGHAGSVILKLEEVLEREMPGYVELGGGGGKKVMQGKVSEVMGIGPSRKWVAYGQCAYQRDTVEVVDKIYPFEMCPLHERGQGPSLLVGEPGSYSVIHIDREDNGFATLYCIEGRKSVIAFSDDDRGRMEVFINKAQTGSAKREIPLTNGQDMVLDTAHFANWKSMKGLPTSFRLSTLKPGDMIVIPPGYWHQVVNEEFSVGLVDVWDRGISHFHDRDNHLFMVQFSDILEGRPPNECTLLTPRPVGAAPAGQKASPPAKRPRRDRR
ncbi:hypothetical protein FOZ60_007800 [Perkinsus olseni]|uniref:JmjC domain-containing protein n=1 Tax=Perkinsus olseni TaxID=32597 RepID=A0A7J6PEK8_PEROL|nr:hypothetical protein FOZ60_007800 [Perkinsus olseni]